MQEAFGAEYTVMFEGQDAFAAEGGCMARVALQWVCRFFPPIAARYANLVRMSHGDNESSTVFVARTGGLHAVLPASGENQGP